ncbi:MAG: AAA family ATPase [Lachnospiraceae bacterium]
MKKSREQFLKELVLTQNSIIGIDGPCGSGKTTLCEMIQSSHEVDVIHLDDFFLPLELRTLERMQECGGNIHYERFKEEVLDVILSGNAFSYRRFDCSKMSYSDTYYIDNTKPIIIEGSYSLREDFRPIYTTSIYIDIAPHIQFERLLQRVGPNRIKDFETKWIPKENAYFEHYNIQEKASIVII